MPGLLWRAGVQLTGWRGRSNRAATGELHEAGSVTFSFRVPTAGRGDPARSRPARSSSGQAHCAATGLTSIIADAGRRVNW